MSASLIAWLPLALLAAVSLLCFVGCVLRSTGDVPPFTNYRGTIQGDPNLVAFWPLGEMPGETTAHDIQGGHDGTYTAVADPGYPTIPPPPGEAPSAKANGTFTLGATGIVQGDGVGDDPASLNTCMKTDGGYVSVPFDAAINPTGAFTIEAWVRVEWTGDDEAAFRTVIDARAVDGGSRGFALYATPDNHWEVWLGNGGTGMTGRAIATTPDPFPMSLEGVTFYLAASFDGSMLRIFSDGEQRASVAMSVYAPNDDVSPHVPSPLYIGAGAPWLPTGGPIPPGGPRWPFRGKIQDVAVYNAALDQAVILKHKHNGDGTDP